MRHLRFLFLLPVISLFFIGSTALPSGAQTLDEITETIDRSGSYLELDLQTVASEAVTRANADGVGFVYLDQENADDLPIIASGLLQRLDEAGSSYRTLIVLDSSGAWVESLDRDTAGAADAAFPQFATGAIAGGIDTVLGALGGGDAPGAAANDSGGAAAADGASAEATTGSEGGVPWLLILLLGLAAFFAVRFFAGRRRKAAALETELAEDRAEIREQLRNNSDHVIDLGDRIATADDDLRRMYEEAAQTFQDVSMGLEEAATAVEIDALDDRLDRAEWQFDVIEARMNGLTPPPEPTIGEGPVGRPSGRQPVPPLGGGTPPPPRTPPAPDARQPSGRSGRSLGDDRPALGADESLFPGGRSGGRSSRRQSAPRRRSRGGGMLGGMLGGMAKTGLLSLVLKMLLGGGLNMGSGSRRTQQRRGGSNQGGGFSGGVGGGVLR